MNWANWATYARILLIPAIALCYFADFAYANVWAALIFTIASITDFLDGYLARRLNQTSAFGAFIDPVADKLLVVVVVIMLVSVYPVTLLATSIIIGREILISALREWMASRGERNTVAVRFSGKLKTTVQMLALIILLLAGPPLPGWVLTAGVALLYVSALLSLWSMARYFSQAWTALFPKA